ncbi:MAG: ankyrin repeat domain-containing protein [Akkermansia sp.]|nr:ankyrin repeat domain-containing protein [Akkermansia sp.]
MQIQSSALPIGFVLRDYTITHLLGKGGFGITYQAVEDVTDRCVVIKENFPALFALRNTTNNHVAPDGADNKSGYDWALKSFIDEARLLTKLSHPHIVPVLSAFKALGTAYYVMPHINGTPLHKCAPSADSITEEWLLAVLVKLLEALEYLHKQNLLHRDIKPDNILMTPEGSPILIDFGAARRIIASHIPTMVGTFGFSPPEQMSANSTPGPWTDIYAVAATCYFLITQQIPPDFRDRMYAAPDTAQLASRTELHGRFSRTLLSSIDKGFALNPTERWQSAREWLSALNHTQRRQKAKTKPRRASSLPADCNRKLLKAAEKGHSETVSILIKAGADVNTTGEEGPPPLYRAAAAGHSKCIKHLLTAPGIDVNKTAKHGWSPLFIAACSGHTECVKLLLTAPGIDVNKQTDYGWTPLNGAAEKGHTECVKALLSAPGIDVNLANANGWTPLYWAASEGHTECVKHLINAPGIDVNQTNANGWAPLYRAASAGHTECVKHLINAPNIDVNRSIKHDWSPLFIAAWSGHTECVKALLSAPGIDANKQTDYGWTPLNAAAKKGHPECVRALLKAPGIDVNLTNAYGWTPLFWAASKGHPECVKHLINAPGIDVNRAIKHDWSPLFIAAWSGHTECVKALLTTPGIDINKQTDYGWTPLNAAAEKGHTECVRALLNAPGIDVNQVNVNGRTPLYCAASEGHTECVKLLLTALGINIYKTDNLGRTPLTIAKNEDIRQLLRAAEH